MKSLYFLLIELTLLSFSFSSYPLLKKEGSKEIYDKYITFDAKDFKNDDEIFFNIKAEERSFLSNDYVLYTYLKSVNDEITDSSKIYKSTFTTTTSNSETDSNLKTYHYQTKYFKIKKNSAEFNETNGDYIAIDFPKYTKDWALVKNTKKDEGKIIKIVIIIIIVAVVVIFLIVIIVICCIKARNRSKIEANQVAIENQKVQAQNYQVQGFPPQPYQVQGFPPQPYQVQGFPPQPYQAQVFQVPPYQCQINQTQNYNNPENYPGENNTHQTFDSSTAVVNQ